MCLGQIFTRMNTRTFHINHIHNEKKENNFHLLPNVMVMIKVTIIESSLIRAKPDEQSRCFENNSFTKNQNASVPTLSMQNVPDKANIQILSTKMSNELIGQ